MKKNTGILLLLLLICGTTANAQKGYTEVGYMRNLHEFIELPLDSIWEYSALDDSAKFDQVKQKANTLFLKNETGEAINWQGTGWFQRSFTLPDSLNGKPILFWIGHIGASEIYLDGQLVQRYGKINSSFKTGNYFVPRNPVLVMPDSRAIHRWTVHFTNKQINKTGEPEILKGFWLVMATTNHLSQQKIVTYNPNLISFSLIFSFFIFFLFVYLFYTRRSASLLTALFLLDFSLIFLSIFLNETATDGYQYYIYGQLWKTTVIILNYLLVITTYALYYKKIPGRVWWLFCCMLVSILLVWTAPAFWQFSPVVLVLLWFEVFRIIFLGIRYNRSGFWILLTGQFAQFLFFHFFINNTFQLFDLYKFSIIQEAGRFISNLLNPLTFALQLAWEFGSSNRSLQKKLSEVEVLSAENILKEQEKQQLLASQNEQLETQVSERTESLKRSLNELRSTQSQLIQKEKMASLGELTAGIAHEIQNPLNFVNNFSEVNKELIAEMRTEIEKGNLEEVKFIAEDIEANSEKINHHGKRADSIVKGMLQHSRSSTDIKEPTDINKLADEYLRLAYQGLRAKDKSFNATLKTDFDGSIGNINIIPQDIGRVLLNLYNNAFYAVSEKKHQAYKDLLGFKNLTGLTDYEPNVSVSTKNVGDKIEIKVSDNGKGIPQKIVDKIFQPFFTTKPTGQGTGLGLSLSYDIVKAHGGEIKVETKVDEGTPDIFRKGDATEFIILLPYKTTE